MFLLLLLLLRSLSLRSGRSRCAGTDLSQRSLLLHSTDLSPDRRSEETVDTFATASPPEARLQRLSLLLRSAVNSRWSSSISLVQIAQGAPASVTLQPSAGDTGKPCGVDYEVKTFVAENNDEKSHKRSSVRLAIRKLTYAPERAAPQPVIEAQKDFLMSPAPLHLECTLDKEVSSLSLSLSLSSVATR